jgi:uncharacterized membrane protein YkoI
MSDHKYTDAEIEKHLKKAIDDSTPDMLEDLIAEIENTEENAEKAGNSFEAGPEVPRRAGGRRKWYRTVAACAAALLIFAGGFTVFQKNQNAVYASVSLDVNPSIELSINKDGEIVKARAFNEDGKLILKDKDLKGMDVKDGCDSLVAAMVKKGYISESSNSVLVSVQAKNAEKGNEMEKMISRDVSEHLEKSNISGAVVGKYVENDEQVEKFAEDNKISAGRAWLIKELLKTKSRHMTEASLLKLSTQELILLGQERKVDTDDAYGKVDTSKYISRDKAVSIALQQYGRSDVPADAIEVEFDCDDGIILYSVEFEIGGQEYEYDINAESGEIMEIEYDDEDADDSDDADDDEDSDDEDTGDDNDDSDDSDDED